MHMDNQKFDLGLTFYEVMDLPDHQLTEFLKYVAREEIIRWLNWNDPNGIYSDEASLVEIGEILSKEEGIEIIKRQIINS